MKRSIRAADKPPGQAKRPRNVQAPAALELSHHPPYIREVHDIPVAKYIL